MNDNEHTGEVPPQTAMSIFPQGGAMNEFPVLKAFQQYIDAEQARARKRMLGLSVFFIILLTLVVATFVMLLVPILGRNQTLQDRLLDMVLATPHQSAAAPVVNVQSPAPAPAAPSAEGYEARIAKIQADNLAALEELKRTYEAKERQREEEARAAREKAAAERARLLEQQLEESMKRVAALEEAAKARQAAADKAAKREAELEEYRRRYYPAAVAQPQPAPPPQPAGPSEEALKASDEEYARKLIEKYAEEDEAASEPTPAPAQQPAAPSADEDDADDDDPSYQAVDYYSQYDDAPAQPAPTAAPATKPPAALMPFVFDDSQDD